MLLLLEIKRHILRTPARALLTACVAALLVCGMAFYLRSIQATQDALDQLGAQMPVRVRVTNRDGSSFTNLRIEAKDFDTLAAQEVRDVLYTSPFSFQLETVDGNPASDSMRVHAANAIAALDGPLPENFTYLEGWDENFLQADAPVCAVDMSFAKRSGIKLGSKLSAVCFSLRREQGGNILNDGIGTYEFTVVALHEDRSSGQGLAGWNATAPIGWLRRLTETAVNRHGDPISFFCDSASAYLAVPQEMNAFKDAMYKHGFRQASVLPDRQDLGDALSMDDEMYIKASSGLAQNLELYRAFLAPFFGLIIFTIALITFLSLRSCRRDIAIASSLGRQKLLNAAAPFFGTLTAQGLGCLTALLAMGLFLGMTPGFAGALMGSFMLCAAGGTALALVFLFRFDTITLLTKTD